MSCDTLCPEFPSNLSVGKQLANWFNDTEVVGTFINNEVNESTIPDGEVKVLLYKSGIKICGKFYSTLFKLHNSQIESITEISKDELKDKSIVSSAILSSIFMGELGNDDDLEQYYLIINYWDIISKELRSISIECNLSSKKFIERFYKEKNR